MSKLLNKLIKNFKKVESELLSLLNSKMTEFDETTQKSTVKRTIRTYIKKVDKAKMLLEQYELLAKRIADETTDELPVFDKQSQIYNYENDNLINEIKDKKQLTAFNEDVKKDKKQTKQRSSKELVK